MITTDRELIESALVKETRTLQRQKLLKKLWQIGQAAGTRTDPTSEIVPSDPNRSTHPTDHVDRPHEARNRT